MVKKIITPNSANAGHPKLIINLADIYEKRAVKEQELEFYQKELEKLMFRMGMLQQDIGTTNTIIKMIENEQVFDLKEAILEKKTLQELRDDKDTK
jgi:hypothetical protein|tara:strand:+ start:99 stop:386 length:288 start_codon:yes stop_codon:yes gene_type:complete